MNRAELMQYIARGGYKVHQGLTGKEWTPFTPESPTINDTEQALIAGHGRRTAVHGQSDKWFGKGCGYQCCQWEETEETGGPEYKEAYPVLIFCSHPNNPDNYEGNCTDTLCPLSQ